MNKEWQRFLDLGVNRKISLTTKPEPYTFDKTLRWLARQVAPTWKLATKLDEINQTTVIKDMLDQAKRSEERRVGKECRSRWSPDHEKKKKKKSEHLKDVEGEAEESE